MEGDDMALQQRIRLNTWINHLTSVGRREEPTGANQNQDVIRELVLRDIMAYCQITADRDVMGVSGSGLTDADCTCTATWTGVLSEKDIMRFGLRPRSQFDPSLLQEDLDVLMLSVSDFLYADCEHVSEAERLKRAWSLPEQISWRMTKIASTQSAVEAARRRIKDKMETTTQTQSQLRAGLLEMISRYPSAINGKRSATNDLLAATIEISLIKLSLVRTRAHWALYEYGSAGERHSEARMDDALSAAHAKLKVDEQKMEEEERELDSQLGEYGTALGMIEGGFAQVVEDWTRVQREKEECRRDLRRLGWTGD